MKKRILFITRNFPPLTGGMERLNYHAFEALSDLYDMMLLGPEGCDDYAQSMPATGVSTDSSLQYVMRSCFEAYRLSRQWKPDLIVAGSGVAALPARIAARTGVATVTLVHGLDIIYPSRLYQMGFVPAIRNSDRVIANSANTAKLAVAAGVPRNRVEILHPGVSLPNQPFEVKPPQLGFDVEGKKILLSVVDLSGVRDFLNLFDMPCRILRRKILMCCF